MVSRTTRKLSHSDDDDNVPDQRTRPRLQIEPLDFTIQLPPSQPPVNTNQDTEQTMFLYIHPSISQPSPDHQQQQPQPPPVNRNQDSDPQTELTMCFYVEQRPQPPPQLPLPHAQRRNRRKQTLAPPQGKTLVIKPPFPWATDRRAKVHSLNYLTTDQHIKTISGDVECKRCQKQYQIEFNLEEKFNEISDYVETHMYEFRDRAPPEWMNPTLPKCKFCDQENSVKPVVTCYSSIIMEYKWVMSEPSLSLHLHRLRRTDAPFNLTLNWGSGDGLSMEVMDSRNFTD
ncbi:hypothetical protein L1987_04111 [Smallanthus sonchifolius]|uniref:Uncharacterized protein n=1 Tax=Smallanthus sonchifolius TaxID=185202 RepID=A0ACB9KCI8_9ASTR|nr:hypothetical protein L1987_04111 [Smallanthus sonchifolius]